MRERTFIKTDVAIAAGEDIVFHDTVIGQVVSCVEQDDGMFCLDIEIDMGRLQCGDGKHVSAICKKVV